jgi:membrane protein
MAYGEHGSGPSCRETAVHPGLRVLFLSVRKFLSDRCTLWASALTFYSLMSIVPVAALVFAVAKGFGFKKLLQEYLMEHFAGQQEVITYVIDFSNRLLDSTRAVSWQGSA